MTNTPEVAIIGAGPYGLSLAAQLRARGVEHRIFGIPMQTWRTQMPRGMHLKSDGFASNLVDRPQQYTLARYCEEQGIAYADQGLPVRLDTFCDYGLAFQKRCVPQLEQRLVTRLQEDGDGIVLHLDDGQSLRPGKVVLAIGISHFQYLPEILSALPVTLCSHSSACTEPERFKGREVTVIGGGASAIDLAGLLHAAGVSVNLIARAPTLTIHKGPSGKPRSLWQRLRHPATGIGHSLRSWLYCQLPLLFHHLPEALRMRIVRRHLGPAGGWFMRDLVLGKVMLRLGQALQQAQLRDGRLHLQLRDAAGAITEIQTEHVIAATGYKVDLAQLPFMDPALLASLASVEGTPVLSANFETSRRGIYVIGPAAANSFGPLMRFAFGAAYTARKLSAHLCRLAPARREQRRESALSSDGVPPLPP